MGFLAAALGLWLAIGFLSFDYSAQQAFVPSRLTDSCYLAPKQGLVKAQSLTLAGESVPLRSAAIRRRLEREMTYFMRYPTQTELLASRARQYFKVIDPILKQAGIPRDFRYVVAIESAFNNRVVSHRGATGLWQLMYIPATLSGLTINHEVDERLHLEKSTLAVARHLRLLHRETGSWTGALAAYNCGLTRFQRHAKRKGPSFYRQTHGLETSRYVYKVMAIKELFERPEAYGLVLHRSRLAQPEVSSVWVRQAVNNLTAFAALHGTDLPTLRSLNPWLVGKSLTPTDKPYQVLVPKQNAARVAKSQRIAADTAHDSRLALVADSTLLSLRN